MKLKCGDIVKNGWAGDGNPIRYFIFVESSGRYIKVLHVEGDNRLHWGRYYATDIRDNPDGKFEVVGHIPLKETIIQALKDAAEKEQKA